MVVYHCMKLNPTELADSVNTFAEKHLHKPCYRSTRKSNDIKQCH